MFFSNHIITFFSYLTTFQIQTRILFYDDKIVFLISRAEVTLYYLCFKLVEDFGEIKSKDSVAASRNSTCIHNTYPNSHNHIHKIALCKHQHSQRASRNYLIFFFFLFSSLLFLVIFCSLSVFFSCFHFLFLLLFISIFLPAIISQ